MNLKWFNSFSSMRALHIMFLDSVTLEPYRFCLKASGMAKIHQSLHCMMEERRKIPDLLVFINQAMLNPPIKCCKVLTIAQDPCPLMANSMKTTLLSQVFTSDDKFLPLVTSGL